jgi:Ca2+-binding EF-hand superfamily protein
LDLHAFTFDLHSFRGELNHRCVLPSQTPRQEHLIKQELHNQMVRLRDAFLRQDPRITGTIPRYLIPATLKAGGMELPKSQLEEAKRSFTTGDGRFNWVLFCDQCEKARKASWSDAARIKSARLFAEIDKDGSGRLGRAELAQAVQKLNIKVSRKELDTMFDSFDEDGDGNLSYPCVHDPVLP